MEVASKCTHRLTSAQLFTNKRKNAKKKNMKKTDRGVLRGGGKKSIIALIAI